jgi:methionine-rich copper-binding protein CopC
MHRIAAILALILPAVPAGAHSLLLTSEPAAEARIAAPPGQARLRFNEPVRLTALRLLDSRGAEAPLARTRDMAPRAEHVAGMPATVAAGEWRLVWRAISADGHEIGGTIRFHHTPATEGPVAGAPAPETPR